MHGDSWIRFATLPLLAACTGGGGSIDYYARFEVLGPLPSAQTGVADVVDFGGEVLVLGGGLRTIDGDERFATARAVAILDNTLVVAADDGVYESTDAVQFDAVSPQVLDHVTAVGEDLVGVALVGAGQMGIFRSSDGGSTWTDLETVELLGLENESVLLSRAVDGVVWARLAGDADLGPNFAFASVTVEVRGEAVTEVSSDAAGGPLPAGETQDGRALVNVETLVVGTAGQRPFDLLPLALVNGYSPSSDLEGELQIGFAMPGMPVRTPDLRLFGPDDGGRLLAAFDDTLVRSERPLTRANDQSDEVLQGSGCAQRSDFDGFAGDNPELTVVNDTDGPVTLWMVDDSYTWFEVEALAAGATAEPSGFSVREGYVAMLLDADGNCRGARFLKEGKATTVTAQ